MKKLLFFKRSKRGFTLTELCIVIAVAAIVGIMITTTVILTSTQKEDIQTEAAFIKEVTDIQIKVNEWIRKYDNVNYTIEAAEGKTELTATTTDGTKHTLTFKINALVVDDTTINTYRNVTGIEFEKSDGTRDISEDNPKEASAVVLTVVAHQGSGEKTRKESKQVLMFPLLSDLTRERIVEGKGKWQ